MTASTGTRVLRGIKKALLYAVLILMALVFLFPFWFMFIGMFRSTSELFSVKFTLLPERGFTDLSSFVRLYESGFFYNMWNTFVVASIRTVSCLLFSSMAGYAFAKLRFPGKRILFYFLVFTMMVPFQVLVIPMYTMMVSIGWVNTLRALIVPGLVTAFGIFMMRQYMSSVPDELLDAAKIDGCSSLRIYWNIALPLVQPGLVVLGIVTFMGVWNDFFWPLIIIQEERLFTITLRLASFRAMYQFIQYGTILAGSFLSAIPMFVMFFAFRERLLTGLVAGSYR